MTKTVFPDFRKGIFILSAIAMLLIIVGCTAQEYIGEDSPTIVPQIFVVPTGTEERFIADEKIPQDNCDGTAETSHTVERSHAIIYTLDMGSEFTVAADGKVEIPEVGELGLGAEVAAHYDVGYGREDAVRRSVTVAAKEGTNVLHTIRQSEIWETGKVIIVMGEKSQELPFSFRRDFRIETLPPANIGDCSVDPGGKPRPTVEATGGSVPEESATIPPVAPASSCIAVEHGPLAQADHFFSGPVHVVQLWRQNGQSPWSNGEVMALVTGDVSIVATGGNVWTYPSAECEKVARIQMQDGANIRGSQIVTLQELRDAGLIK